MLVNRLFHKCIMHIQECQKPRKVEDRLGCCYSKRGWLIFTFLRFLQRQHPHLIRTFVCCWKNLLLWLSSWFFPFELLGSAEKPMAGPSSCKGKIMRWEKFQIIGSKHKCSYYLWSGSSLMVFWCHFCPSKRIIKPKCSDFFFTLCSLQTHSVINTFVQSFKNAFSIILLFLSGKFCQFCTFLINKQITCLYST